MLGGAGSGAEICFSGDSKYLPAGHAALNQADSQSNSWNHPNLNHTMSNHSTSHTPLLSKPQSSNYHSITQEDPTLHHHSIHHHDLLIEDHPQPNPYISPPTPLPKLQVSIICLMRLCEPIAFTVVFPMVAFVRLISSGHTHDFYFIFILWNIELKDWFHLTHLFFFFLMKTLKMIADFDPSLTEKEIGFYSGAVESVFAMSQLLTIMIWGRLSDRIGRKPVLLLGISGAILSTILFGFSQSFHQMLLARGIGGILNGKPSWCFFFSFLLLWLSFSPLTDGMTWLFIYLDLIRKLCVRLKCYLTHTTFLCDLTLGLQCLV